MPKPSEQYGRDGMARVLAGLQESLAMNAPPFLVASQVVSLFRYAELVCGLDLWAEFGKRSLHDVRQRGGFCHYCESSIPCALTHHPVCEHCDARIEAEAKDLQE